MVIAGRTRKGSSAVVSRKRGGAAAAAARRSRRRSSPRLAEKEKRGGVVRCLEKGVASKEVEVGEGEGGEEEDVDDDPLGLLQLLSDDDEGGGDDSDADRPPTPDMLARWKPRSSYSGRKVRKSLAGKVVVVEGGVILGGGAADDENENSNNTNSNNGVVKAVPPSSSLTGKRGAGVDAAHPHHLPPKPIPKPNSTPLQRQIQPQTKAAFIYDEEELPPSKAALLLPSSAAANPNICVGESRSNSSVCAKASSMQAEARAILAKGSKGNGTVALSMFSTGRGSSVRVKASSMQAAATAIEANGSKGKDTVALSMFSTGRGSSVRVKASSMQEAATAIEANDSKGKDTVALSMFSTGRGTSVRVKTSSMRAAASALTDAPKDASSNKATVALSMFSTGRGSSVRVKADTLRTASKFATPGDASEPKVSCSLFSTAKGSSVSVSKSSLSAADKELQPKRDKVSAPPKSSAAKAPDAKRRRRSAPLARRRSFKPPKRIAKKPVSERKPKRTMIEAPQEAAAISQVPKRSLRSHYGSLLRQRAASTAPKPCTSLGAMRMRFSATDGLPALSSTSAASLGWKDIAAKIGLAGAPAGWIENHFRWIVWKLSNLQHLEPAKSILNEGAVMQQLRSRYEQEVRGNKQPAMRLISQADCPVNRQLVVVVSQLYHREGANHAFFIEVTDGWYSLPALCDEPLTKKVADGHIRVGSKLMVCCSGMMGQQGGVEPLDVWCNRPASLCDKSKIIVADMGTAPILELKFNSTRPAPWYMKLGFVPRRPIMYKRLTAVIPSGGRIPYLDVVVLRCMPLRYMERPDDGGRWISRSSQEEADEMDAYRQRGIEAEENGSGSIGPRDVFPVRALWVCQIPVNGAKTTCAWVSIWKPPPDVDLEAEGACCRIFDVLASPKCKAPPFCRLGLKSHKGTKWAVAYRPYTEADHAKTGYAPRALTPINRLSETRGQRRRRSDAIVDTCGVCVAIHPPLSSSATCMHAFLVDRSKPESMVVVKFSDAAKNYFKPDVSVVSLLNLHVIRHDEDNDLLVLEFSDDHGKSFVSPASAGGPLGRCPPGSRRAGWKHLVPEHRASMEWVAEAEDSVRAISAAKRRVRAVVGGGPSSRHPGRSAVPMLSQASQSSDAFFADLDLDSMVNAYRSKGA